MPSKNPSKKALPLKNLLRTLLRSVRLHDPLGVRPKATLHFGGRRFLGACHRKAMTPIKLWTLLFLQPRFSENAPRVRAQVKHTFMRLPSNSGSCSKNWSLYCQGCEYNSKSCSKNGLFSVTFLAGHGEICHPHGRSTRRPADQPTTRRSTRIWGLF